MIFLNWTMAVRIESEALTRKRRWLIWCQHIHFHKTSPFLKKAPKTHGNQLARRRIIRTHIPPTIAAVWESLY